MSPKVFEKPSGLRDYLPEAARRLRAAEMRVLECMERWGYQQIITPTLEYYDTVGAASSTASERLFKLLDHRGTTLVLRSEMTAPIARVVSSLLRDEPLPLRLSHHSNVFRAMEEEAGREAEFFQTGVELVGDDSPEADAEVIALAIHCLQAAGVREFKMAIGHIGFLDGLLNARLEDREQDGQALKELLLKRDYVGYRQHLQGLNLSGEASADLENILRMRGGRQVLAEAERLARDEKSRRAAVHLAEVWDALQAYGVSDRIIFDLTMISNFSYYTGLIFEGYAAELGFPVCNGGRYDHLLEQFGRPAPATGFALATNRIVQVTDEPDRRLHRVLILYNDTGRTEAIRRALELRSREGCSVETRYVGEGSAEAQSQAAKDAGKYDVVMAFDQ